eukprot:COSAG01_NODE_8311_length_2836_cov_61.813665_1_plen_62_part_00
MWYACVLFTCIPVLVHFWLPVVAPPPHVFYTQPYAHSGERKGALTLLFAQSFNMGAGAERF